MQKNLLKLLKPYKPMKSKLSSPAFQIFCHGFGLKRGEFVYLNDDEQNIVVREFLRQQNQQKTSIIDKVYNDIYPEEWNEAERDDRSIELSLQN